MPLTSLVDLLNVEVFADAISTRLGDAIRLYNLAYVQNFENQQVGTITVPSYRYIGDSLPLAEGVAIDPSVLASDSDTLTIMKLAQAIELSDEALRGSYGNPIQEAERQLTRSIANGIERELMANLADATLTYTSPDGTVGSETVLNALSLYGEDQDGPKSLLINPDQLANVRQDVNFENNQLFDLDLVVSNRVNSADAFIIKPEGLGLYMAKSVDIEVDRDILAYTSVVSCSAHFTSHLRDSSKVVRIGLGTTA